MLSRTFTIAAAVATILLSATLTATAQSEQPARPSFTALIDVNALIDNHVRFLARKYDLTEEQEAYTLSFLQEKADGFLAQHRDELFAVADRLFEVRGGGEMSQDDLIEWGKRALPVYEEAKAVIIQGNDEWRQILTDEQRLIHDEDLNLMYESFADTEDQLQRVVTGQMTVDEFRRGPRSRRSPRHTQRDTNSPPQPREERVEPPSGPSPTPVAPVRASPQRPAHRGGVRSPTEPLSGSPGRVSQGPPLRRGQDIPPRSRPTPRTPSRSTGSDFESEWERYVREFIEKYQLDEAQTQRAQAILKDCQEQAQNYLQRRKAALEQLDKRDKDLGSSAADAQARQRLREQRERILAPVNRIFEERLKPRLEKLPTRQQRDAAETQKPTKTSESGPGPIRPVKPPPVPDGQEEPQEPEEPPPDEGGQDEQAPD